MSVALGKGAERPPPGVRGRAKEIPCGIAQKKRLNNCLTSLFPVLSCKIAFLFGKAQDLQEELFFTIQLAFLS
jgi:hypothetical protein